MRVVYAGGSICDLPTLKRLMLIADEVGFMDRPSVTFGDWGTVGQPSQFRRVDSAGSPVKISVHGPPSGPANSLYQAYIVADLSNPRFVSTFLDGLRNDSTFQARFIKLEASYGDHNGRDILRSLLADADLPTAPLNQPVKGRLLYRVDTPEGRRETLKAGLIEASIHITNALVVAAQSTLVPVSDDPYFCRLMAMRTFDPQYVAETPHYAPLLGLAVIKSVLPDALLAELTIPDLLAYRRDTKDAYASWSAEIDKLAAHLGDMDPQRAERTIPAILIANIKPKVIEYRNEMKAARDRLFGDLLKKTITWDVPTISVTSLASLAIGPALAAFAGALSLALPPVIDYLVSRRDVNRRNSMAYLIGISKADADDQLLK